MIIFIVGLFEIYTFCTLLHRSNFRHSQTPQAFVQKSFNFISKLSLVCDIFCARSSFFSPILMTSFWNLTNCLRISKITFSKIGVLCHLSNFCHLSLYLILFTTFPIFVTLLLPFTFISTRMIFHSPAFESSLSTSAPAAEEVLARIRELVETLGSPPLQNPPQVSRTSWS